MFKNFFRNKNKTISTQIKTKSCATSEVELLGYSLAGKMQWSDVTSLIAWNYYKQCSVVYHAVNLIAKTFSIIPPRIYDLKEDRYLTQDDSKLPVYKLLDLLKMPMFGLSYTEFAIRMINNYLATGNLFLIAYAINDKRPPVELEVIMSQDSICSAYDKRGYATQFFVTNYQDMTVFKKDDVGRFWNNNSKRELWHTKIFNPTDKSIGLSPFSAIYYEIEQLISSAIHNGNILKQGARPAGALIIPQETDLSDDQLIQLKSTIRSFYSGSGNAGNVLILQGGKEFKELSVNNKDMDYFNMKLSSSEQVYRNMDIPMSLVSTQAMTLDNFKLAMPVLYEMATLPMADIIFGELNLFLMQRYDNTGRYELTYNKRDISALTPQFNQEVDRLIKSGLLTLNEGRSYLDLSPIVGDGGNEIFTPSNLIPVGVVENKKIYTKKQYEDLLRKNNFSEEKINFYINKYYSED